MHISVCHQLSENEILTESGFLPLAFNQSECFCDLCNNDVLHLYSTIHSSKELRKLYKHYLIKFSQPPCEAGNDKRDYPWGTRFPRVGQEWDEPPPVIPGQVPTVLEIKLWSAECWRGLVWQTVFPGGPSGGTSFSTCPCTASRDSHTGKPCLGPPIWKLFGDTVDRRDIQRVLLNAWMPL